MSLKILSQQILASWHSQPFKNCHFHFITVKFLFPIYWFVSHISHPAFISDLEVLGCQVQSFWLLWIFLNSLLHFLTCYTVIVPSPYISVSWQWILMGENISFMQTKSYYELLHRTKLPVSLPVHINFSSESYLTVVPSVVCYHYYKCYFLPKYKMLITKVTGWGTILIEHAWCYWLFLWNCYAWFSTSFSFLFCVLSCQESTLFNSQYSWDR